MAHRAGYINIIGAPNVGKSTLVNALLGERLVITNPKAQTTRHRILGIINGEDHQLVLSDTPGILEPKYRLHRSMMSAVSQAINDADVLLVMVELGQMPEKSEEVLRYASRFTGPLVLLVNKMDTGSEEKVLGGLQAWQEALPAAKVVPLSALHGFNVPELREYLVAQLPEHPAYFPKDELSDRDQRFFVSEMIREKVLAFYREELPYSTQVVVNSFEEAAPDAGENAITKIQADVIVMRDSQKGIIIGKAGAALKKLGTEARKDIEAFVGTKVFLDLKVRVDENWREDDKKLKKYGY